MDNTFRLATFLSHTNAKKNLDLKKKLCCEINGFYGKQIHELHPFNKSVTGMELVMKPQTFHSALSIYILLKYPQIRSENSFINLITDRRAESVFMKLVTDVLSADDDGVDFIKSCDPHLTGLNIFIDEHNNKVTIVD